MRLGGCAGRTVVQRCDIVHHTYYSKRFLHRSSHCKQVTTVYDMIPELLAEDASASREATCKAGLRRADAT